MTTNMTRPASRRTSAATLSPSEAVSRLRTVTERLTDVINAETARIADRQPAEIIDLQEEKTKWANEYAMDVIDLAKVPHLLDRAPAASVADLKAAITRLHERLAVNAEALQAASSVSQRLVQMITRAANEHQNPKTGYGKDATMGLAGRSKPATLSLDQRI